MPELYRIRHCVDFFHKTVFYDMLLHSIRYEHTQLRTPLFTYIRFLQLYNRLRNLISPV